MKKVFKATRHFKEWGGNCRITAIVTDERGYLSITGELIPPRCRTPHCCGHMKEEINKAFPKLRKLLPYHCCDISTGFATYAVENSAYCLVNGDAEGAKSLLHATEEEIRELKALCDYGLHVDTYKWSEHKSIKGQSLDVYKNAVKKMGIPARVEKEMSLIMQMVNEL